MIKKEFFVTLKHNNAEVLFEKQLDDLGIFRCAPLALAVSGGADSMALLHLTKSFTKNLVAITVDHALRPESRSEAEKVAQWCHHIDIEHHILTWYGEKPETRIQREARRARYDLMTAFCQERGISHLLTAHHKDDQIETFFLRLLKGSGLRGLACMAPIKKMGELHLIRPFLNFSKKDLVDYLNAKNQAFVEDPSNDNLDFGRVRVRQWLAQASHYKIELNEVLHTIKQAQDFREFMNEQISCLKKECLEENKLLLIPFYKAPPYLQKEFLRNYIAEHSNKDFPPRFETIENLHTALVKGRSTTAGGFIWRVKKDCVVIEKEVRL